METIRGRMSLDLNWNGFKARLAGYNHITLDLGTGDGRFVRTLAKSHPERFVVGVDACRENLREHSRAKLPNMLFVIASAQELPCEFVGLFSQVNINFPWGSLLEDLLASAPDLMHRLADIARSDARIEIHVNGGALMEAGSDLDTGVMTIHGNLCQYGWKVREPQFVDRAALSKISTTWARRLAHGRDPRAMFLSGRRA